LIQNQENDLIFYLRTDQLLQIIAFISSQSHCVKDKKPLPFWESHKILLSSRREIAVGLRGGGGGARVGP
jgi:hypothetical protein